MPFDEIKVKRYEDEVELDDNGNPIKKRSYFPKRNEVALDDSGNPIKADTSGQVDLSGKPIKNYNSMNLSEIGKDPWQQVEPPPEVSMVPEGIEGARFAPKTPMTTGQQAIATAMRVVPNVAGMFVGGALGTATEPGLGTLLGAAAGRATLSGAGELAGEAYENYLDPDRKFNPWQIGTQAALGIPNIGGVAPLRSGAQTLGARELFKNVARNAGRGALQGAGYSAISTFPTEWAESGGLPTLEQVGQNAGFGGIFGGATGAIGSGISNLNRYKNRFGQVVDDMPPGLRSSGWASTREPLGLPAPPEPPATPRQPGMGNYGYGSNTGRGQQILPFDVVPPEAPVQPPAPIRGLLNKNNPREFIAGQSGISRAGDVQPLDPADTSRFPQTYIPNAKPLYYTPEERAAAEQEPVIEPPRPSTLGMYGGQGPQFGIPQGGEQLQLPVAMQEQNPSNPVIEPPVSQLPPRDTSLPEVKLDTPKPRVRMTPEGDVVDPETGEVLNVHGPDEGQLPQEMRVPKYKEGNTGLANVSMGGANRRTLDVLGSSLYTRPRPVTTVKELLQNAFDEHKEFGITEPVRVLIDTRALNPITDGGEKGKSITVRDRGRGLMPDEIYTVLTNIGETGKAGVESASGGFGFAKAAPFLGGKWAKVTSVVDTPKGRMRYTFEGTPEQLKPAEVVKQTRGVPLNEEKVGDEIPTGLEVTTWYDNTVQSFYETANWARNMAENSPSAESGILLAEEYGTNPKQARRWLDETPENSIKPEEHNYLKSVEKTHKAKPSPTLMDTIDTPGAKVNIHYDIKPKEEHVVAKVHKMNKGMYQGTDELSYGAETENVPGSIVADIIATVEEGHDDYPFGANREQVQDKVTNAIDKWVRENIITGVTKKRVAAVQRKYDSIDLLHPNGETEIHYLDDGKLLTPEELETISSNPAFTKALKDMEDIHIKLLETADALGWSPESYQAKFKYPSERLKKFGVLFQAPDKNGTVLGIHIPRPDDPDNSAILINIMEHLNLAANHAAPIDQLTTKLLTTLIHEIAHIPGGGHDKNHSYRDADLHSVLGGEFTVEAMNQLGRAFDDGNGNVSPEISEILQVYNDSRGRTKSEDDDLVKTGINSRRPPDIPRGKGGRTKGSGNSSNEPEYKSGPRIRSYSTSRPYGEGNKPFPNVQAPSAKSGGGKGKGIEVSPPKTAMGKVKLGARKTAQFMHGAKATGDLGPVLRQGKNLAFRPIWWKALGQQFKSYASEGGHEKFVKDIQAHPLMKAQDKYSTHKRGKKAKKEPRSYIEYAGVHIDTVGTHVSSEEAAIGLDLAEKFIQIPGVVNPARASNRAYQDTISTLRVGLTEILYNNYKNMYESLKKTAKTKEDRENAEKQNPDSPELAARIGREVNQTTGRSDLGKFEGAADDINLAFFAARNFKANAEQIIKNIKTPFKFFGGKDKVMRNEHLKQLLSYAALTVALSQIYRVFGGEEETDPRSSAFGKAKFGKNVMADYAGGQGKFVTITERARTGKTKTRKGKIVDLTNVKNEVVNGNVVDLFEDMVENQVAPPVALAMAILNRRERFGKKLDFTNPNPFENTATKLGVTPISWQNFYDLAKEDKRYLPLMGADLIGSGISVESDK